MSQSPEESYKSASKELDILLRVEGGVDTKKRSVPKNLASEMAARLPGRGFDKSPSMGGHEAAAKIGGPGKGQSTIPGHEMAGKIASMQPSFDSGGFMGTFSLPDVDAADMVTDPEELIRSLTLRAGHQFRSIREFDLTDEQKVARLVSFIPSVTARDKRIFPVDEIPAKSARGLPTLLIAISDPHNVTIIDDIRLMLPEHEIDIVVCPEDEIVDAIDRHYGVGDESLETVIDNLGDEDAGKNEGAIIKGNEVEINVEALANDPPVIKLVNLLMLQAIQDNASDLHIEPFANSVRIRYRVDGVLREIPSPPKNLQLGLISRIKVMANLNISESRKAQDGRIRLSINGREIDLRVASVPTVHGESIVMRVLDKTNMMIGVSQLGMQQEVLTPFLKTCKRPNGIVLVTGPTGSGKTTTLYSVLTEVFDPGHKFITVEDPVEYELPGIVQVSVNSAVGLTFAACLRCILRQDPDVILVGEIRDVETASIAVQAALTGHLVLSTTHTNSAAATVNRLVDMGIEPFLLTSTLQAVVGQRLVRTICQRCRTEYIASDEELEAFGVTRAEVADIAFSTGRGCDECNRSGYRGRIGLFEVLQVSDTIRELILQRSTADDLHALAVHEGMMTMRQDGWLKVCYGVTSFEEVNRQTHPETEESIIQERESVRRSLDMIAKAQREREGGAADDDAVAPQIPPPPSLSH
ncbi:MAG: GspE/PulE family protein [Candidatus Sumerlaeia bacterium]|nr:GspE/PulE family protein [Candidatus Sumerlaeia bacterium]